MKNIMKKLFTLVVLAFSTMILTATTPKQESKPTVYTTENSSGILLYSQPVQDMKLVEVKKITFEKFKKLGLKAWYQDEEKIWKELIIVEDDAEKIFNTSGIGDIEWSTPLELSTHAETKPLSKPASF